MGVYETNLNVFWGRQDVHDRVSDILGLEARKSLVGGLKNKKIIEMKIKGSTYITCARAGSSGYMAPANSVSTIPKKKIKILTEFKAE